MQLTMPGKCHFQRSGRYFGQNFLGASRQIMVALRLDSLPTDFSPSLANFWLRACCHLKLLFVFVRLGLLFRQVKAQGYCKTVVILSGIDGTLTYPLTNCSWLRMNHQSYDA